MKIKKVKRITAINCSFRGKELSKAGIAAKRLDYGSLVRSMNAVPSACDPTEDCEVVQGDIDSAVRWLVIDGDGAVSVQMYTDDPLVFIPEWGFWMWGITFAGIAFDDVLTKVKFYNLKEEDYLE